MAPYVVDDRTPVQFLPFFLLHYQNEPETYRRRLETDWERTLVGAIPKMHGPLLRTRARNYKVLRCLFTVDHQTDKP